MTRKITLLVFALFFALTSCNQNKKNAEQSDSSATSTEETQSLESQATEEANIMPENVFDTTFKTDDLSEATRNMGAFPYYTVPDWLVAGSYGSDKNLDFSLFEIYTGKGFYSAEGRVSTQNFNAKGESENQSGDWSEHKFVQSFSKHFESLGAKKIWEGTKPYEALSALSTVKKNDMYAYNYSSLALQENQVIYGLNEGEKTIFFVIATDTSYGSLSVIETKEFEQTITTVPE